MPRRALEIAIGGPPGTDSSLVVYRFGTPGARPRVVIQAGLHADEVPGMLVAHRLAQRLAELDAAQRILGEILVAPAANPLGLTQRIFDHPVGRFDLTGQGNFNRHYADLTPAVAERVRGRLGSDPIRNVDLVRQAAVNAIADVPTVTMADRLRVTLLRQAVTADIVLDLHCDDEAPVHLYLGTPLWPDAMDLARDIGATATFLADSSGGNPFDEACSAIWWKLPALLGDGTPLPCACLAATVEYRGMSDVDDDLATRDADGLVAFLARRGAIGLTVADPPPLLAEATPLAGVEMLTSPRHGIIVFRRQVGDAVAPGDRIAEIVDPVADPAEPAVATLTASADGMLFSRTTRRFARPGDIVAKIAGATALPGKGDQLLTA